MAILNYTTTVDARKTVAEIQEKLSRSSCKRVIIDYDDDGNPISVSFGITWGTSMAFFRLPCEWESVLKAMENSPDIRKGYCTKAQAYRVTWRIIKDWIEAQLAMVEAKQATMAQVFTPYAMTKQGKTVYEVIIDDPSQLLLG